MPKMSKMPKLFFAPLYALIPVLILNSYFMEERSKIHSFIVQDGIEEGSVLTSEVSNNFI